MIKSISSRRQLDNQTVVTCVLYILFKETGSNKIHTEDIAYRCFELIPEKFRWQTLSKQHIPDIEPARRGLMIARSKHKWVYGHKDNDETKSGWSLTDLGVDIAKKYLPLFEVEEKELAQNKNDVFIVNYLTRIKKNKFCKIFNNDETDTRLFDMNLSDVAQLLETGLDIKRINEKFFETINFAHINDPELINFLNFIAENFSKYINRDIQIKENSRSAKSKSKMEK